MAGGGGTRLWPLSTKKLPKQFLNLSGRETLVNEAVDRLLGVADKDDIFIVTNASQTEVMLSQTAGRVKADHILAEPAARNTAACIGYAAITILKKYGDGIMCVVPSDPYIRDEKGFQETLQEAVKAAEETDALVTIGDHCNFGPNVTIVTPMHPMLPDERRGMVCDDGVERFLCYAKPVTIGHDCWFGANVVVCPGVTIGENCVIGAGSVVTRDIPAGSFAAGNPARVIRPITAADTVRGRFPGIRGE